MSTMFWFKFIMIMITLVSSQCNYFSEPGYSLGAAQPIGRCIADYTNTISRLFTCSSDGNSVTAQIFQNSTSCDTSSTPILSETFESNSSSTAEFECNGDNSCDLCYRVYSSCDDTTISNAAYEKCFINDFCSDTTGDAVTKDGSALTPRSEKVSCISKTHWKETSYEGNDDCSSGGSSQTNNAGCATNTIGGDIYYEIITTPCVNESGANLMGKWLIINYVFMILFLVNSN